VGIRPIRNPRSHISLRDKLVHVDHETMIQRDRRSPGIFEGNQGIAKIPM